MTEQLENTEQVGGLIGETSLVQGRGVREQRFDEPSGQDVPDNASAARTSEGQLLVAPSGTESRKRARKGRRGGSRKKKKVHIQPLGGNRERYAPQRYRQHAVKIDLPPRDNIFRKQRPGDYKCTLYAINNAYGGNLLSPELLDIAGEQCAEAMWFRGYTITGSFYSPTKGFWAFDCVTKALKTLYGDRIRLVRVFGKEFLKEPGSYIGIRRARMGKVIGHAYAIRVPTEGTPVLLDSLMGRPLEFIDKLQSEYLDGGGTEIPLRVVTKKNAHRKNTMKVDYRRSRKVYKLEVFPVTTE